MQQLGVLGIFQRSDVDFRIVNIDNGVLRLDAYTAELNILLG
jgi:hypothetical protein